MNKKKTTTSGAACRYRYSIILVRRTYVPNYRYTSTCETYVATDRTVVLEYRILIGDAQDIMCVREDALTSYYLLPTITTSIYPP